MIKLPATRTACFVTKANHSERMGRKATCLGSKDDGRGAAGETVHFASVRNQVSLHRGKTLVCSPAHYALTSSLSTRQPQVKGFDKVSG